MPGALHLAERRRAGSPCRARRRRYFALSIKQSQAGLRRRARAGDAAPGNPGSLGADGAPCNNTLDMFHEMRQAALIQKPIHGATTMSALTVFERATLGGAATLGLEGEIGSLEPGKRADISCCSTSNKSGTPPRKRRTASPHHLCIPAPPPMFVP